MAITDWHASIFQKAQPERWVGTIYPVGSGVTRRQRAVQSPLFCALLHKMAGLRIESEVVTRVHGDGYTAQEWYAKVRSYGGQCHYCHEKTPSSMRERDHLVPIARGGSNTIDNVVPSCRDCNRAKGKLTADEFAATQAGEPVAVPREHGLGSIYQRSDGRWCSAIELGRVDGKRRRKVFTSGRRDVVEAKLAEALEEIGQR